MEALPWSFPVLSRRMTLVRPATIARRKSHARVRPIRARINAWDSARTKTERDARFKSYLP